MTRRSSPPTGTCWYRARSRAGRGVQRSAAPTSAACSARAIELAGGDPGLQPARLTVDLLRPVALADPVRVDTNVERDGRRIRLVDAAMRQNDTVVARASALFLRRGEQPPDAAWTMPIEMPPPPISRPTYRETSPWNCGPTAPTRS